MRDSRQRGHTFVLYGYRDTPSFGKCAGAVHRGNLDSSEFWRDRFSAFGLFLDDLKTMEFSNRYIPGLLPKGYTQPLVA